LALVVDHQPAFFVSGLATPDETRRVAGARRLVRDIRSRCENAPIEVNRKCFQTNAGASTMIYKVEIAHELPAAVLAAAV
jgi:hypothetical protein